MSDSSVAVDLLVGSWFLRGRFSLIQLFMMYDRLVETLSVG